MSGSVRTGSSRHFVLAAGGTGGHLIPAFALATELDQRGHHVALITDQRGAEIPGKPDFLTSHVIPAGRFGKNPLRWFGGLKALLEGRRMALRLFESFEPTAVVGFGGYPAAPAMLAATSADIPSVIHEQNAVLGRVNRMLAGRVDAIATAFTEIERLKHKYIEKVHLVGNPVRPEVLALRDEDYPPFTEDGLLKVLVTGGSQGARILGESVPPAIALLPEELRARLRVAQQARPEDIEHVTQSYLAMGVTAEIEPFFRDIPRRLSEAQLVISRAGASSVADISVIGRPAILIPFAAATADHQTANARGLVDAEAAILIPESQLNAQSLAQAIEAVLSQPDAANHMAQAALAQGMIDATERLVALVETLSEKGRP